MRPTFTQQYAADKCLGYSKLLSQQPLIWNGLVAYSENQFWRKFGIGAFFSAWNPFRIKLGPTAVPSLGRAVSHIAAIITSKQMNRPKAGRIVTMMANQDRLGNLAMHQNVSETMRTSMLARYLDFAVSVPKEITIPQEAWV